MSDDDKQAKADVAGAVNYLSEKFDQLCQDRHNKGLAEYGEFTFLGNDVVRMMLEELADTANYCRMQFVKLMLMQEVLEEDLSDKADSQGNITLGVQAFKGVGDIGWKG